MNDADAELLRRAQRLLEEKTKSRSDLKLRAIDVTHDADITQILISHADGAYLEDYVHILAAVEADLDVKDDVTVLLVPVAEEAA